jgi:hypothetical protein
MGVTRRREPPKRLRASGGTKSGKKRKATTDLTEGEMPAPSGGSWKRSDELMFALLEEKQKGHFEAEKLELAEEKATFYERPLPGAAGAARCGRM